MGVTVAELGEFELIAKLAELLGMPDRQVVGIGDDGAVLPLPNGEQKLVVTTDTMVEGRHFKLDYTSFFELGVKIVAVNLSDLAAMGADPLAATVTLQLPPSLLVEQLEELYRGMRSAAGALQIVGGDTVQSEQFAIGVTAFGLVDRPMLRRNARPSEELWVSGPIGGGGVGLAICRGELDPKRLADLGASALARYRTPVPRVELGKKLVREKLSAAAIDISDGLLQDLGHMARSSGVDIIVELELLPLFEGSDSALHAATAGDDYELAFTAEGGSRGLLEQLGGVRRIGRIAERAGGEGKVWLVRNSGEAPVSVEAALAAAGLKGAGYQHFGESNGG